MRPFPLESPVCYDLHNEFRALVEKQPDCSIRKVIELKSCVLLLYWIDCPKHMDETITEMAFMTHITNPKFQKYYADTKAFKDLIFKQNNTST